MADQFCRLLVQQDRTRIHQELSAATHGLVQSLVAVDREIIYQNQDACLWISLPHDSLNLVAAGSYGPRPGGEGIVEEDSAGGDLNSNGEDRER
jgi:hypothetical protein